MDIESAELTKGAVLPSYPKGDPVSIDSIALELLSSALPSVPGPLQAWTSRQQDRSVKRKAMGIKFEGSPEDLHKLLETFSKEKNL